MLASRAITFTVKISIVSYYISKQVYAFSFHFLSSLCPAYSIVSRLCKKCGACLTCMWCVRVPYAMHMLSQEIILREGNTHVVGSLTLRHCGMCHTGHAVPITDKRQNQGGRLLETQKGNHWQCKHFFIAYFSSISQTKNFLLFLPTQQNQIHCTYPKNAMNHFIFNTIHS